MSSRIGHPSTAIWLAIAVMSITGCTTAYDHPPTEDRWEVPTRFDRDTEAEDEEAIFVLRDEANDISAVIQRITPAYPDLLVPDLVAAQIGHPEHRRHFDRLDAPVGWRAFWTAPDSERWVGMYAFSGDKATYVLSVDGPEQAQQEGADEELFDALVDGFSPAESPQTDDRPPTVGLHHGLGDITSVHLKPVGADDRPRSGSQRDVSFPSLRTTGQLLREPMTVDSGAEQYLGIVLERIGGQKLDSVTVDQCAGECAALHWQSPDHDSGWHLIAVVLRDREAFQIRLRLPSSSTSFEDLSQRWLATFLADPAIYFEEDGRDGEQPK